MAKGANAVFGCSVKFLRIVRDTVKTGSLPGGQDPYRIWEDKTVLQKPCLFKNSFHTCVVSGSIDLGCCLSEPDESILDLHMSVWRICDGRVFQKFREQERILANSLHWLRRVRERV